MKFILLFVTILFTSVTVFSQDEDDTRYPFFSFGTELGFLYGTPIGPYDKPGEVSVGLAPNIDTITLNKPTGSLGIGPQIGVFSRYNITKKISVQAGIGYSVKKAKYKAPANEQAYTDVQEIVTGSGNTVIIRTPTIFTGNVRGEFNNKYLTVPIIMLYRFSDKWTVNGGGYAAFLLKGSHKVWATGIVGLNGLKVENQFSDESEAISKWDYGVNAGVSYNILRQLEAEFRISTGLGSIFEKDYEPKPETVRNVYLELKANYVFDF